MKFMDLNKYDKRSYIMMAYVFLTCIMIVSTYIWQYPGGLSMSNMATAVAQCLIIMAIMLFLDNMVKSFALIFLSGIIYLIGGSTLSGGLQTFIGLLGYLIYLVRFLYNRNKGNIEMSDSPKERFKILLSGVIKPMELYSIYKAILIFVILSVFISTQRSFVQDENMGTVLGNYQLPALHLAIMSSLPIFSLICLALNLKDGIYLKFIESVYFIYIITRIFIANPTQIIYAFQIFEYLLVMIACVYSLWYNDIQSRPERYIV